MPHQRASVNVQGKLPTRRSSRRIRAGSGQRCGGSDGFSGPGGTGGSPPERLSRVFFPPPRRLLWILGLLFLFGSPTARGVPIKGLTELKVGDQGHCLTVFKGLRPEKFSIRVEGILFNFFPQQHLILVTSDDPKVKHSGIVAGMSGSPCYVDGKLVGALAYGPNWTKRPIAMLTPIQHMLDELKRPLRGMKDSPLALARPKPRRPGAVAVSRTRQRLAWRGGQNPLAPWYRALPAPLAARVSPQVAGMRRLSVPLAVSGFDTVTLKELKKELEPYGMEVVQGGSSSAEAMRYYSSPKTFENGGSIGVQLMRGAISMNGTGTVTLVQGQRVLAFGHPMANWGEHYVPVTGAWIHMFMPSYSSSYKISTALSELGSLVLDRRACILAETGRKAPMIPVAVTVESPAGGKKSYDFELFSNERATTHYLGFALQTIVRAELPDAFNTSIDARFSFDTDAAGTFELQDHFFAKAGASLGWSAAMTRGYRVLSFLMATPLAQVRIKRIRVHIRTNHRIREADIFDIKLPQAQVRPGEVVPLTVGIRRRFTGARYERVVPIQVPSHLPHGAILKVEVSGGLSATIDAAPPETLADVRAVVARMYNSRQLVVRVMQPGEGTSVGGRIVTDLPGSVLDSLRTGASAKTQILHRASVHSVVTVDDVLHGKQALHMQVHRAMP